MHIEAWHRWQVSHRFLGADHEAHALRTRLVIALTAGMMLVEIAAGMAFGSMALLADGWHMASHAGALGITALGYGFSRRHEADRRFSFGTGKVGDLAGFSSALILAVVAVIMGWESVARLIQPMPIAYDEALLVAVAGLVVNLASALLLRHEHGHDHHDDHGHSHADDHDHHADHNMRAAYLHVLADALTSLLAIAALLAGRQAGWAWLDPAMGLVGGVVIARWAIGLMRETGRILLDCEVAPDAVDRIRADIEAHADDRVVDLHVWRVGPGHLAVILSLVTHHPAAPEHYKGVIARHLRASHVTVEVNACA